MVDIVFNNNQAYELAAAIGVPLGAIAHNATRTISTLPPLAAILGRIEGGKPTILPRHQSSYDEWLVVGTTNRDLITTLTSVSRFVVPSYAELESGCPQRSFNPSEKLTSLAADIYPAGYYILRSPPKYFTKVLERVGLWDDLDKRRPSKSAYILPGYRDVYAAFSAALSASLWDEASSYLELLEQRALTTSDNISFLKVQLLAQQRRWADLWARDDFADIARLRAPRAVRDALLASFHQSVLLPLEQQGQRKQALDEFRRHHKRFSRLFRESIDTTYGPALMVYAYRAADKGNREMLVQISKQLDDHNAQDVLEDLLGLLPPAEKKSIADRDVDIGPSPSASTPKQMVKSAIQSEEYTAAWDAALKLHTLEEQAQAMLEIAYLSDDPSQIDSALLALWALPESQQHNILQSRRLSLIATTLTSLASTVPTPSKTELQIEGWIEWLTIAVSDPDNKQLIKSLDTISALDSRYWTITRVSDLAMHLTEIAMGAMVSRGYIRDAVRHLRDYFLQEPEFPREQGVFDDVYEALYLATLEQRDINEPTSRALLRLAEARLYRKPSIRDTVAQHLTDWFKDPIPALEGVAQEAFDLLSAYGVQGPILALWYRNWMETLLAAPRLRDQISLQVWLYLGEWVQPGDDLLVRIRERLATLEELDDDPIAALPRQFSIAIFTLRHESAMRVEQELHRRNDGIVVHICEDTVLTDRAKNLAQMSDMSVIVTTCITHALTYGIGPYLQDPVYPQSSGTTSILRSIVERAAQE